MPSIIDQIREQQAWEQPKKSSSVGFIVGTIAAFAIGVMLVLNWSSLPQLSTRGMFAGSRPAIATPAAPGKQADISIPSGGRLGTAAQSRLLRTCAPAKMLGFAGGPGDAPFDDKYIYQLLQTANQAMSIAAMAGAQNLSSGAKSFASIWGEVADCIFRQNGSALCEPDTRALAVEAVTAFVRQSAIAAAPAADSDSTRTMSAAQSKQKRSYDYAMQNVRATRERVLSTLKTRAQEGRFIASDFGFLAPAEVAQIFKDTKASSDACAARS